MKSPRSKKALPVDALAIQPASNCRKQNLKGKKKPISRAQIRKHIASRFSKRRLQAQFQQKRIPPLLLEECLEAEGLRCTICLELMVAPTTLPCGHTFCLSCVQSLNKTEQKYRCALCRALDFSSFYEVDPLVEKLLTLVEKRLQECERKDYEQRKEQWKKGSCQRWQKGEEVKVRLGACWERATVETVLEVGSRRFYKIKTLISQLAYLLPENSINLAPSFIQVPQIHTSILFPGLFIEQPQLPPINEGYNIEELLWEVNYYSPTSNNTSSISHNWWNNFQPSADAEDDSVMFLGRNVPRNDIQVIEID